MGTGGTTLFGDKSERKLKVVRFLIDESQVDAIVLAFAKSGYHVWTDSRYEKTEYGEEYVDYVCVEVEEEVKGEQT